ncbi:MAG: amino acid permease [Deltaproteobacteria bacterium]|nr:amino acid permease [Deltaproteobacteria bacterium]MBN2674726.1 amino acid permease [Deltaproteobacteria bacterium]
MALKENVKTAQTEESGQNQFGMFGGVFTPCVLTILGVIMFMRAGFVVGHTGIWLALLILGISKLITSMTSLSISAISTNIKMKGGGVYYMISRVLGPDFGGSIGITLFLAQAVGVAFYIIGFTEALFSVLAPLMTKIHLFGMDGNELVEKFKVVQIISSLIVLALFKLTAKGADVAIKTQYFVFAILMLSVAAFVVGGILNFDMATYKAAAKPQFTNSIGFWAAFAIFFPATTGITAGANMSGDLKDPAKSIPWGTILAIIFTAIIYGVQLVLIAGASDRADLKASPFEALQEMSIFGPLVVMGVFAATLSSALGSFLGAPRILQAMGQDRLMKVMEYFAKGEGPANEPKRATVLTFFIAVGIIWAGDLNAVAEVISMFFLIAYGMINLSAFVESKSGNPSFRPTFKYFHWITAFIGAIGCAVAMMKINDTYALVALGITAMIYFYLKKRDIQTSYGDAKRGYVFQRTKDNLIYLEGSKVHPKNWRPIMVALCDDAQGDHSIVRTAGWLESSRGLLTVANLLERVGDSTEQKIAMRQSREQELKRVLHEEGVEAFAQTVIVDDYFAGLTVFLQSYSIGALKANTVMLEMPKTEDELKQRAFYEKVEILGAFNFNLTILKTGNFVPDKKKRRIDLWWGGDGGSQNGSLMAIFAYLMTLHSTWSGAQIRFMRIISNSAEKSHAETQMQDLKKNIRIPAEVKVIQSTESFSEIIARESSSSDFVYMGMRASNSNEARASIESQKELLAKLPTTILVWSNGDANILE